MAYRDAHGGLGGFTLTPWVKRLLIANTAVFLVTAMLGGRQWLELYPAAVLTRPWTLVTYMFAHGGVFHLLVNMLGLFFFGTPLEERWGSREFIKFYLICGLGGALASFVFYNTPVIGASAAVYGVMLAFAMNWPDAPIYIYAIFPVKAKWLVTIFVAISLFSALTASDSGVAHFAHLGGFAAAWLYLKLDYRTGAPLKRLKRFFNRPKLTVISGSPPPPQPKPRARRLDERAYDDVDKVLDKISTQGIASLTPEERKLLDEVSRKYRQN